ncbi:hypothetical protein NHJ13734_006293 [Beauveria thailandica]
MPCCVPGGCPAEAAASEKIRRATLETMQHEKLSGNAKYPQSISYSADHADGLLLRSEVDAAICMSQFQLRDGRFTDHHTKPILIMTILPEQVARLTQTHFDAKQNRLILRQSRLLDLSGKDAGDDAWLLRRWMASTPPVGQTKYPEATDPANGHYEEKLSLITAPRRIWNGMNEALILQVQS